MIRRGSARRCAQRGRTADCRSTRARGSRTRKAPGRAAPSALLLETLDRVLQRLVLGTRLERLLPDLVGLVALPHYPEHLAQVRGDLGVRTPDVRAAQLLGGALEVAFAIQHPAEAVHDEVILGRQLERFLDQLLCFRQAQVALGK